LPPDPVAVIGGQWVGLSAAFARPAADTPHADPHALLMHPALRKGLDAAPNSRKMLRHLATVEHHLWRSGSLFLHDLSLSALQRILDQLDGVAGTPLESGLAPLRGWLVDTIAARERPQRQSELLQPRSSFFFDHKIEVREASVSEFDRALGARRSRLPGSGPARTALRVRSAWRGLPAMRGNGLAQVIEFRAGQQADGA
jgi:hypothetical protein